MVKHGLYEKISQRIADEDYVKKEYINSFSNDCVSIDC